MKTATAAAAALLLSACATISPEQVAQNRRELTAPKIGCAEVDVRVEPDYTRERHDWEAWCRGEKFHCKAEVAGNGVTTYLQTTCNRAQ